MKDALKSGGGTEFVVEVVRFNEANPRPLLHKSCSAKMNSVEREKEPACVPVISSICAERGHTPPWGQRRKCFRRLHTYGVSVPPGFCCTFDAWRSYRERGPGFLSTLKTELSPWIDPSVSYAVRSSADVEDRLESSFAGQFATLLDVRGPDDILRAITAVWESAASESVLSYARKVGQSDDPICMSVIVQRMVTPKVSGVTFSRNPMTGLNEVVVEAIEGRGDALVQQGKTPARWVNKWGGWIVKGRRSPPF